MARKRHQGGNLQKVNKHKLNKNRATLNFQESTRLLLGQVYQNTIIHEVEDEMFHSTR